MSFIARALASIPSQIFCYSAISSAGIVLVLPGYMIREFPNAVILPSLHGSNSLSLASLLCLGVSFQEHRHRKR